MCIISWTAGKQI